jgi:hypothetical protein
LIVLCTFFTCEHDQIDHGRRQRDLPERTFPAEVTTLANTALYQSRDAVLNRHAAMIKFFESFGFAVVRACCNKSSRGCS